MVTAVKLLKNFKQIKTLPHIAIRLTQLLGDENTTVKNLEEVIKLDPTLILRVLRLVNSSYYGLMQKVEKVSDAVVYLGLDNIRNMVVVEALKDIFKQGKNGDAFSREQLWLHSAVVGICCQMISERMFSQKGEDAFLCGVLHDIGIIVEDQVEPELFLRVYESCLTGKKPFMEYESELIGTTHCSVGFHLAKEWKLPAEVQNGIRHHHKLQENILPDSIPGILQLSEYLATQMGYSAMPDTEIMLSPPLRKHIQNNVSEYKIILKDLPEEIEKAKEIYHYNEDSSV